MPGTCNALKTGCVVSVRAICRETGKRARISDRQRKLQQGGIGAEPVRVGRAFGEIRAELPPQIGAGQNAGIDLVTEFREYSRRRQSHPISTGFVDPGLDADILDNRGRQPNQFLAFHFGGEIAWIGIPVGDLLDKGRRIPGLQMRADLANTGFIEVANDFIAFRYRTDRIVHNECRPDVVSLENRLHLPRGFHRSHAVGAPRTRRRSSQNSASVSMTTTSIGR